MQAEQAIARLEAGLRQLKIEYDLFFAGVNPRPPGELRSELERLIKRFANASFGRYAEHYHFQTLVGRFNTYVEMWNRRTRVQEEGRAIGTMPPPRFAPAGTDRPDRPANRRVTLSEAGEDQSGIRSLYDSFVEASRKVSGQAPKLSLDSFARQLSKQIDSMKKKKNCGAVEFHVSTANSKVSLKARPAREKQGVRK